MKSLFGLFEGGNEGIRAFHLRYLVWETGEENSKSRNEQLFRCPSIFIDEIQHPSLRTQTLLPLTQPSSYAQKTSVAGFIFNKSRHLNATAASLNEAAERKKKVCVIGKGRLSRPGEANEIALGELLPSTSSMARSTVIIQRVSAQVGGQQHRWPRSDRLNAIVKRAGEWRDGAEADWSVCARTDAHRQGGRKRQREAERAEGRERERYFCGYEPVRVWRVKHKMHKSYKSRIYVTFSSGSPETIHGCRRAWQLFSSTRKMIIKI